MSTSTSTNSSSSVGPTSPDNPPTSSTDTPPNTDPPPITHHSSSSSAQITDSPGSSINASQPISPISSISSFPTANLSSSHPTSSFALTTRVSYSNGIPYTTVIETVSAGVAGVSTTVRMTKGEKVGAVVGGVVGGLGFLTFLAIGVLFFLRRRRKLERAKRFDGNFDPAYASTASSTGPSVAASTIGFGTARSKRQSRATTPRPMSQIVRNLSAASITDPRQPTLPAVELDHDEFEVDDSLSASNGRHSRAGSLTSSIPMSPVSSHSILAAPAPFPPPMDGEQEGQGMRHSRRVSSPPTSYLYGHTSGYQTPQAIYEYPHSTRSLSRSSSLHGYATIPQDPFATGAPPTPTSISGLPNGAQAPRLFAGGGIGTDDESRRVSGRMSPPVRPRSAPLGESSGSTT